MRMFVSSLILFFMSFENSSERSPVYEGYGGDCCVSQPRFETVRSIYLYCRCVRGVVGALPETTQPNSGKPTEYNTTVPCATYNMVYNNGK